MQEVRCPRVFRTISISGSFNNRLFCMLKRPNIAILVLVLSFLGCGKSSVESEGIRFNLDKGDEALLLDYYLGSYISSDVTAVLDRKGDQYFLVDTAELRASAHLVELHDNAGKDGQISWDEFEAWILSTYYTARDAAPTVAELKKSVGDWGSDGWFVHEVRGQMTPMVRRLSVRLEDLRAALLAMRNIDSPIKYPVGTAIIGEHSRDGGVQETTVMMKREDGFWDYYAYDASGELMTEVEKDPDPMTVPTKCVGCHFGDRQFEPERSFPGVARPGPRGERTIFVEENLRNQEVATRFSEHARRSDTILGLYATLFVSDLIQKSNSPSQSQPLDSIDIQILNQLGFD